MVSSNKPRLKGRTPRNRQWQFDTDYWDKLSLGEREWLLAFLNEYYNADVYRGAMFHKTKEQRSDCRQRKSRADRDLYSILGTGSSLVFKQI